MPKANDKDVYYFSHDCNARNDEKILALRSVYGLEGYAIYFMLIEILREQPTYRLPITKYTYNTLAMQMQCECSKVESIVHDCCNEFVNENSALLKIEDGYLLSESLLRRMDKVDSTSKSRQEAANIRWNKQTECNSNANAKQKECNKIRRDKNKIDENKLKEKRRNNINFIAPTLTEIEDYCKERKNDVDPKKFYDYFDASGWVDSKGNKVKSWKQKIITWERKTNGHNSEWDTYGTKI